MHNIFKIDQKSLSKLCLTSQQIFTCSKTTGETLEVDVSTADFKQENVYLDSLFWLLLSIYIDFFQTIRHCCQVHVQVTSLFKKISIGMFKK